MKLECLAMLFLISFLFACIEGKSKLKVKKLKAGKPVKKIKKVFIHKHHKKASSAASSFSQPFSIISPTATTFTQAPSTFISKDVYFTYTDKNYNYFFGYPSHGADGANYYRNPKLLIAQPTQKCACCDNKIIIVTRAPNYEII